jgi:hypothetical protein
MIFLYVGLGVFLIIFQEHFDGYSKNTMAIFGIIIILYGAFRFGKSLKQKKETHENQ